MRYIQSFTLLMYMVLFAITSCNQDDSLINESDTLNTSTNLTESELLCIKDDIIEPLSEDEVLDLLNEYEEESGKSTTTKSTSKITHSINKEYFLTISNTSLKSSDFRDDSIQIYEVEISNGTNNGFALVSADRRSSGIMAYISNGSLIDTTENLGLVKMLILSNNAIKNQILEYNTIIDSLKEKTIDKICNIENISKDKYYEDNYAEKYVSKQTNTQTTKSLSIGVIGGGSVDLWAKYYQKLNTIWGQGSPYNNNVPVVCGSDRAQAGCVAIAMGQILTYYQKQPINDPSAINYDLFINYRAITNDDEDAAEEVSNFIADLGEQVDMLYTCSVGSWANGDMAAYDVMEDIYGLTVSKYCDPLYKPTDIQYAMSHDQLIFAGGVDPDSGGHAWVIDGSYGAGGSGTELLPLRYYVHCNFGWSGLDNGWFCIASRSVSSSTWNTKIISTSNTDNDYSDIEGWIMSE